MKWRIVQTFPYPEGERYMALADFDDNEGMARYFLECLRRDFTGQRFEIQEFDAEWKPAAQQ